MTIETLEARRSVRCYLTESLPKDVRNKIKSEITFINSHEAGLNFQAVFDDDAPFRGFGRSYGIFRNVGNYVAVVVDPSFPYTAERAGYFAQNLVLEMVKLGLGTCFVGGTFSRDNLNVRLEVYEKVPFIIAFGYSDEVNTSLIGKFTAKIAHLKKVDDNFFWDATNKFDSVSGLSESDIKMALRAVKCAPSALNSRPVRLCVQDFDGVSRLIAKVKDYDKNAIELGIAKCNVASVIQGLWEWGNGMPFIPD